ncbi:MAG: crossover junction endodeoxyribonuclease RuvC [Loktanella sp.]|nr:crossover junction endodeoxyribonuclease RuvC [Loktanella sp.]
MAPESVLSLGLDLSISATGLVVLRGSSSAAPKLVVEREVKPPAKATGIERPRRIVEEIMTYIHAANPDVVVVEGYSLNMKNASSVVPLVELGGILRLMLMLDRIDWLDPRAGEVKKFATGRGNANKNEIMMNVFKRWGHESKTDNTADAYVLACMGLARRGALQGATNSMKELAGAIASRSR